MAADGSLPRRCPLHPEKAPHPQCDATCYRVCLGKAFAAAFDEWIDDDDKPDPAGRPADAAAVNG